MRDVNLTLEMQTWRENGTVLVWSTENNGELKLRLVNGTLRVEVHGLPVSNEGLDLNDAECTLCMQTNQYNFGISAPFTSDGAFHRLSIVLMPVERDLRITQHTSRGELIVARVLSRHLDDILPLSDSVHFGAHEEVRV